MSGTKSGYWFLTPFPAPQIIGSTDKIGFKAVEDKVHLHDFHSTILRLMGLDHEKLSVNVKGLNMRLTDLHGYHDIYEKLTGRKSPP